MIIPESENGQHILALSASSGHWANIHALHLNLCARGDNSSSITLDANKSAHGYSILIKTYLIP